MTVDDISTTSSKFWGFHCDPAVSLDGAATSLAIIQYNLCAGTISKYIKGRPELVSLVQELLRFDKQCGFPFLT